MADIVTQCLIGNFFSFFCDIAFGQFCFVPYNIREKFNILIASFVNIVMWHAQFHFIFAEEWPVGQFQFGRRRVKYHFDLEYLVTTTMH